MVVQLDQTGLVVGETAVKKEQLEANWLGVGVEHHGHTFNSEPNRDIRDNQSLRMHLRDAGWIIGANIFFGGETASNMGLMPSCANFL